MKRVKTLTIVFWHNVGNKEVLKNLLNDMDAYAAILEELFQKIEQKLDEIKYIEKLMEIKGNQPNHNQRLYWRRRGYYRRF